MGQNRLSSLFLLLIESDLLEECTQITLFKKNAFEKVVIMLPVNE
jgi:hypothetical protein